MHHCVQSMDCGLGLKFSVNVRPSMYVVFLRVCVCVCVSVCVYVVDKLVGALNRFPIVLLLTMSMCLSFVGCTYDCVLPFVRTITRVWFLWCLFSNIMELDGPLSTTIPPLASKSDCQQSSKSDIKRKKSQPRPWTEATLETHKFKFPSESLIHWCEWLTQSLRSC